MIRRKLTLAAAVVTATAMSLTACSGGEAPAADITSISIMAPFLEAQPPSADGAVQQKLEEITGKDVNITWTPNASYEDKTNITLASSELPHVMVIQGKTPGFVKNAEAGAFWDLTDKLGDYPNLKTTFPDIQENASIRISVVSTTTIWTLESRTENASLSSIVWPPSISGGSAAAIWCDACGC